MNQHRDRDLGNCHECGGPLIYAPKDQGRNTGTFSYDLLCSWCGIILPEKENVHWKEMPSLDVKGDRSEKKIKQVDFRGETHYTDVVEYRPEAEIKFKQIVCKICGRVETIKFKNRSNEYIARTQYCSENSICYKCYRKVIDRDNKRFCQGICKLRSNNDIRLIYEDVYHCNFIDTEEMLILRKHQYSKAEIKLNPLLKGKLKAYEWRNRPLKEYKKYVAKMENAKKIMMRRDRKVDLRYYTPIGRNEATPSYNDYLHCTHCETNIVASPIREILLKEQNEEKAKEPKPGYREQKDKDGKLSAEITTKVDSDWETEIYEITPQQQEARRKREELEKIRKYVKMRSTNNMNATSFGAYLKSDDVGAMKRQLEESGVNINDIGRDKKNKLKPKEKKPVDILLEKQQFGEISDKRCPCCKQLLVLELRIFKHKTRLDR